MALNQYESYLISRIRDAIWDSPLCNDRDYESTEDHQVVTDLVQRILVEVEGLDLSYGS